MKNKYKLTIAVFLLLVMLGGMSVAQAGSIDGDVTRNNVTRHHYGPDVAIDADTVQGSDVIAWLNDVEDVMAEHEITDDGLEDQIDEVRDLAESNEIEIDTMKQYTRKILRRLKSVLIDFGETDLEIISELEEQADEITSIRDYIARSEAGWSKDNSGVTTSRVTQMLESRDARIDALEQRIDLLEFKYSILEEVVVQAGLITRAEIKQLVVTKFLDDEANGGTLMNYGGNYLTKVGPNWRVLSLKMIEAATPTPEPIVEEPINVDKIREEIINETINETNETAE